MFLYKIDEELALKLIHINDTDEIFQLTDQSRAYLREWLPWLDGTTKPEDTLAFIQSSIKGYSENNSLTTVILFKGKKVGIAGFNSIDWTNKIAYIGYWLGKDFQGKGIMTRVAKALTDYAFQELKLNKVEIRAAVNNKKSRSVPERLNYVEEGRIRQVEWLDDHYVDHVVYGILKEEWEKR